MTMIYKNKMVIYKTTNLVSGKIYIGQDKYNNPNYFGSGKILRLAIKKYGVENFKKEILQYCNSNEELNEMEKFWIASLQSTNKEFGYNIANGGQGGEILDWNTKISSGLNDKRKESAIGRTCEEETKIKISIFWENYRLDKLSKVEKTIKQPNKVKLGKENPFYGKSHSGDMSRFGVHRVGKTPTNAHKIKRLDTMEIFDSANDAAKKFSNPNTARRAIVNVCKGLRESFQDVKFEFV